MPFKFIKPIIRFFQQLVGGQSSPSKPDSSVLNAPQDESISATQSRDLPSSSTLQSTILKDRSHHDHKHTHHEHLEEASFRYGSKKITVCKSHAYVAIKKKPSNVNARRFRRPRNEQPKDPSKLGSYELIGPMPNTFNEAEETLDNLRTMPNVAIGTHVFHRAEGDQNIPYIPTEEIYIVFRASANLDSCLNLLDQLYLEIVEKRTERELIIRITERSKNPIKTTLLLQASDLVEIAEPELISPPGLTSLPIPKDELFSHQWHLDNKGQHGFWPASMFTKGADAKVVQAWNFLGNLGSDDLTIAVIDSGFDISHPDLAGDAQNPKIVAPWDFENNTSDPSPKLGDWHGTACAGVALASANGQGVVGAAPNSRFMPLRFSFISDRQIEKWFAHAVQNGADIISNSWGSQDPDFTMSTRMFKAIRRAATEGRDGKGCVILFAAGNTNRLISDPADKNRVTGFATHPDVITVSASNSRNERSSYSNFGYQVTIAAPSNGSGGAGVTTTDVTGTVTMPSGSVGFQGYSEGDYTGGFGGTSSSCPLVAGITALMLSANKNLSAQKIKAILEQTTDKIGQNQANEYDENGHSLHFGYGKVNALKAVQAASDSFFPVENPIEVPTPIEDEQPTNNEGITDPFDPNFLPPFGDIKKEVDVLPLAFEGLRGGMMTKDGVEHLYKISISKQLSIYLDSPLGDVGHDFDIYVKKGEVPRPNFKVYDKKSNVKGSDEKVVFENPELTDYFTLVKAYKGSGGYNLELVLETESDKSSIEPLPLIASTGGILLKDSLREIAYKTSNHKQLIVNITSPVGNANFDIYVKRGATPRWNDYDGRGISKGAAETVVINQPAAGDYYILIRNQKGSGGYNLNVKLV